MSISVLRKVSLLGLTEDKPALLEHLQCLGCMHLLALRPPPAEPERAVSPQAQDARAALRFLSAVSDPRRQVLRDTSFDVLRVVEEALRIKQSLRDVSDRRDFLARRIADVEPWGDLCFPPLESVAGMRLWFYALPLRERTALGGLEIPWQIVGNDHRFCYVVLLAKDEPPRDVLPVRRTHTGSLSVRELREALEDTELELDELRAERHALTRYVYLLSTNLAEADNRASLAHANEQMHDCDGVVAVQGWVPLARVEELQRYAEEAGLACLVEAPHADESPPTLLEEKPEMAAGVDLAMFYQIPSYRAWDPSRILFCSFSIFFAMILSDAGYGTLLLGLLAVYWRRLGSSEKGRAYRVLGLSLFGCSIGYGLLVGSYFGVVPEKGALLDSLHVLDTSDYRGMMKISIGVGVFHLMLAQGITAFISPNRWLALAHLGWVGALLGGFMVAFGGPGGEWSRAGQIVLASSLGMVFLFSSERRLAGPGSWGLRAFDGVKALAGVMGMFGDVLSYMRLFALGLASASLALTFNSLATQMKDAVPGLGLLLAIVLLVLGHVLNLGLAIMSGVVHGLRLNFMEFYKWALPEEGEAFRRFSRKEVQP